MNLTDEELSAAIKACDIHRQSLARRLPNVDEDHRVSMLNEIEAINDASTKLKAVQSGRFRDPFEGSVGG